ncbi:hypothetical protein [Streptomyces sp. NRRL S-350]|uniref:hypothetical protein n=1 Tax=Streptomyces sp. NRRL S-350 TaxID=1463902 RepID=UPI0004C02659|nr:hypothetical protein [Streptomyces sp. NRRL S-350]
MPRFRFHHNGAPETYHADLLRAWTDFCARHGISAFPRYPTGDPELDAWNASHPPVVARARLGRGPLRLA